MLTCGLFDLLCCGLRYLIWIGGKLIWMGYASGVCVRGYCLLFCLWWLIVLILLFFSVCFNVFGACLFFGV